MSDSDLSVDPAIEPATPEPQPVDANGQPIPTPEPSPAPELTPEPEPEAVTPGLALAAPAYKPPAPDFEHTAFSPENVQNIS